MNEDKIKVGEYVRTKNGYISYIRKVIKEFDKNTDCYIIERPYYNGKILKIAKGIVLKEEIVKHSKNIIDLIEAGDYVNGHLVRAVYLEGVTKYIKLDNSHSVENNFAGIRIYKKDIRSIVTKEQFAQIQYKVGK